VHQEAVGKPDFVADRDCVPVPVSATEPVDGGLQSPA